MVEPLSTGCAIERCLLPRQRFTGFPVSPVCKKGKYARLVKTGYVRLFVRSKIKVGDFEILQPFFDMHIIRSKIKLDLDDF